MTDARADARRIMHERAAAATASAALARARAALECARGTVRGWRSERRCASGEIWHRKARKKRVPVPVEAIPGDLPSKAVCPCKPPPAVPKPRPDMLAVSKSGLGVNRAFPLPRQTRRGPRGSRNGERAPPRPSLTATAPLRGSRVRAVGRCSILGEYPAEWHGGTGLCAALHCTHCRGCLCRGSAGLA